MPSVKLSPVLNDTQFSSNNTLLAGGKIYWYIAGTSTPVTTYTDSGGVAPQENPIILNTRGEVDSEIWLQTGQVYKAIVWDSLNNFVRQFDDISGVNDTSVPVISEWVTYGGAPTYISVNSFSLAGDVTATFTLQRRVKATVSAGDYYGTITNSAFSLGVTTVTLANDAGKAIDSGISQVFYGFLDPSHPSVDLSGINSASQSAFQTQLFTAFTTGGTTGAFTLTPIPAITAYSANQRFNVKFNASGNGTDTINVSGLGAKSIKQYDSAGVKQNNVIIANQLADIEYDGTDFVILNPLAPTTTLQSGISGNRSGLVISATGTSANITITANAITGFRPGTSIYRTIPSVSLTLNTATVGSNGLDTGTLAANTWYYIFIATNLTGATNTCLCSTSPTSFVSPGGFSYWARVGAFKTDGTANKYPLSFIQYDNRIQFKVASGSNLTALPIIASGSSGNVSTPTWTSFSLVGSIPTTASRAHLLLTSVSTSPGACIAAPNNSYGSFANIANPPPMMMQSSAGSSGTLTYDMILETTNVYYAGSSSGNALALIGWTDNL